MIFYVVFYITHTTFKYRYKYIHTHIIKLKKKFKKKFVILFFTNFSILRIFFVAYSTLLYGSFTVFGK
jgi:hypothetical protein